MDKTRQLRATNRATRLIFDGFAMVLLVFMVFNCSQMANLGLRMDCNTFWDISGTYKKSTKYGPSDPSMFTEIC